MEVEEHGMRQRLAWPAELAPQEDGSALVSFPDIPEALTAGETQAEAPAQAQHSLIAALGDYLSKHSTPSHGHRHPRLVGGSLWRCRRQNRAIHADARRGHRQHRTGCAAQRLRGRSTPADRPRPPFACRADRNRTACAWAAASRRDAGGIDLGRKPAPDEPAIGKFRRPMEKYDLGAQLLKRRLGFAKVRCRGLDRNS